MAFTIYSLSLLLRVDAIQHRLAKRVTSWIQETSNLPLEIGSVRVRHLNKIEINDILLNDLEKDTLACIEKITVHISPLHLLRNRVRVNSVMLASPTFRIKRSTPQAPLNAQFLFELLAGNDTTPPADMPNIRINQLHMYDGHFSYHVGEKPSIQSKSFSPQHIEIDNISANISLKELSKDTLRLHVRNLSGIESSGMTLKNLKMRFRASKRGVSITKLKIEFPEGEIVSDRITANYSIDDINSKSKLALFDGYIYSNNLSLHDFAPLLPQIQDSLPTIKFAIKANGRHDVINLDTLAFVTNDSNLSLNANAKITELHKEQPLHEINIKNLNITQDGARILHKLSQLDESTFDIIKRVGNITLTGSETGTGFNTSGNISLNTDCGDINADLTISEKKFTCSLEGKKIDLGTLVAEKRLKLCDINSQINGIYNDSANYSATILSTINSLEFNGYTYSPIEFEGSLDNNTAKGAINISDNNMKARIFVGLNHSKEYPEYDLRVEADSINLLPLNLSKEMTDSKISFKLEADYTKNKSDKSLLTANLYNFELQNPDKYWKIRRINVTDNSLNDKRTLLVSSDIFNSYIHGYYNYNTLANSLSDIIHRHIPSFEPSGDITGNNKFVFNIDISNSEILSSLLNLPFTIHAPSNISGNCNDSIRHAVVTGDFKDIDILDKKYKSVKIDISSDKELLLHNTHLIYSNNISDNNQNENKDNEDIIIKINSTAQNDTLRNIITWEEMESMQKRGNIGFNIFFGRVNDKINFNAMLHPGMITYGDSIWNISESRIENHNNKYHIHNFAISNNERQLHIDGTVGTDDSDSLNISLKDIQVEDVMNIVNFHSVDFGGRATGNVSLSRILSEPAFSSNLVIKDFKFEKGLMGNMVFRGDWEEDSKSVKLHGRIENGLNTSIASGIVSPANDTINIRVRANGARIEFLNDMLSSALSDVDGEVSGELSVRGKMRDINLYGALSPTGTLRLKPTNTIYTLKGDTVLFTRNKISFDNFEINDRNGNKGFINGVVRHNSISRFSCNFGITAKNLLAYDTHGFGNDGFYGTAFVTGTAKISVDNAGIRLNAEIAPENNSRFVYNAAGPEGATNNDFVTFTDRQSKKHESSHTIKKQQDNEYTDFSSKLRLDFMINTTPGMQLRVYTNTVTGDYIDIYGNGPINAIYDEKEGFNMKGNLNLTRGTYKFTLQDIFPKEFSIKPGSTLAFNGDPFLANLNLNTVYTVASAPLTDLSITAERRKNVKVNCLMDITGTLQNPTLTFGLELPDGNEEEKELLASATSTPEQTNMQFIYLIGIGKFYTYDYNNQNNTSQSSTAMESLISSTISGQLNNMLSQITDSDNWNISGNFTTSERGWNSMEVEGMLSGRLLNNRLLVNGNFGYRDNPLANKNFIGDFEVQWLLDNNGNVSLKAYSKTNDRYFSKTTLTTQGAGIMLKHDFNSWLFWRKNKNKNDDKQSSEK